MKISSLRLRLALLMTVALLIAWCVASILAYDETRDKVSEVFDTQQSLLARQLLGTGLERLLEGLPVKRLPQLEQMLKNGDEGDIDNEALGFAVFDAQGKLLVSDGENGRNFVFESGRTGFVLQQIGKKHERWRIVFMKNKEGSLYVAVGQEIDFRRKAVRQIVYGQFWPWLAVLPVLVLLMWWMIGRALAPLRTVASELTQRQADDATPIEPQRVPSEVRPLIVSLNTLFRRVSSMLEHSRRFTADAAHELRSPLAGLRVQAEVAQMADHDPVIRANALRNLNQGIDRATRLVEQLLALSRLDPLGNLPQAQPIDWRKLVQTVIDEVRPQADAHGIELNLLELGAPQAKGDEMLLGLLLRNLLDNAIRYTPQGGHVTLTVNSDEVRVDDDGPGVAPEYLERIRERFFRPPGQHETGSGLGLSIVERIAALHDLTLQLSNLTPHGLSASVRL